MGSRTTDNDKDRAAERAVNDDGVPVMIPDLGERASLTREVITAIRLLLFVLSRPLPADLKFDLVREVCGIARALGRISITEPPEVIHIFKAAVLEAQKNGLQVVNGLNLVKILEIIFDPALAPLRESAQVEQTFAELQRLGRIETLPVRYVDDPSGSSKK